MFRAGISAADPRVVTRQAVEAIDDLASSAWVIAVGKAAHGMATGAVEAIRARRISVAGGLVVAHEPGRAPAHGLPYIQGNHPVPGVGSQVAADSLLKLTAETTDASDAIVLISGGGTSLIAASMDGLDSTDLRDTFDALLASGADIELMNAMRKRLLRFGAGRLALALHTRRIHCLIASDVIGNDPASIASGPCVPDTTTAADVRARAKAVGAWDNLPAKARTMLDAMADGSAPDVPRRDDPRFDSTTVTVILDRTNAEHGAAAEAQALDVPTVVRSTPLTGDAATAGASFAKDLTSGSRHGPQCIIWSGETTVSLGSSKEPGGRCQEFALACAGELERAGPAASGITVLAAGTDGRDGPTDAAGAIVDAFTWSAIRNRGTDPAAALRHHASYNALEVAEALLKTGATGTNVNDLVVALIES